MSSPSPMASHPPSAPTDRPCAAPNQATDRNEGPLIAQRAVAGSGVEATSGFEPLNRGFADLPLNHLGTSPRRAGQGNRPIDASGRSGPTLVGPKWLPLEDSNLA